MRKTCLAVALASGLACSGGGGGGGGTDPAELETLAALAPAFGGIDFDRPVKLVQHPTDDDRWYVVQQGGEVYTFDAGDPDPGSTVELSVDVGDDLEPVDSFGGHLEQGLLGMAFDVDFASTGEVYLTYTHDPTDSDDDGDSILARYVRRDAAGLTFEPDPDADPVVLSIPHGRGNHNGGDIHFGASDEYLYYSMGDGGGGNDPDENGQDTTTLLGTVMRLDVNATPPMGDAYVIPPTNPFAGHPLCDEGGGSPTLDPCPEIFAFGLRNPWRMGFDPLTGALYLGDVGQSRQEEVDRIVSGGNYGWDCVEGELDLENVPPCDPADWEAPLAVHGRADAFAITGGVVYRGTELPDLVGFYVYGDFGTGNVWALDTTSEDPPVQLDLPSHGIAAFSQGRDGEVYLVTFDSPSIYRLVPVPPPPPP